MKKSLFLLTLFLFSTIFRANADQAEVTISALGYGNGVAVTDVAVGDHITLIFDKGTNNNPPAYYNTGTALRMYGGNTLTVTAATGYKISDVIFTFSGTSYTFDKGNSAAPTVDPGTYNASTYTWSFDDPVESAVLTAGGTKGHARISKITVVYEAEGGETPDPVTDPDKLPLFRKITETPAESSQVLIVFSEINKLAGTVTKNFGYIPVLDAEIENDELAYSLDGAYTVTPSGAAYTIQDPTGRYLYQTGNYNSFNFNDTNAGTDEYLWHIFPQPDGTFRIENVSVSKYMQYDSSYGTIGSYNTAKGILPELFAFTGVFTIAGPEIDPATMEGFEAFEATITGPEGYEIHYTLDGTVPTAESPIYTEPLTIETSCVLKAVAIKDDVISAVTTATYTLEQPDVELTPADAVSDKPVTVTMTQSGSASAHIYYTLDGTTPTEQSTEYTAPITITESTVVRAIAVCGQLVSNVTEGIYQIGNFYGEDDDPAGNTTVSFIFKDNGYDNQEVIEEVGPVDGVTISLAKGTNSNNAPLYYTNGEAIRFYNGNTITVSSANSNILKIEITYGKDTKNIYNVTNLKNCSGLDPDSGAYTEDGENGVWEGDAASVALVLTPATKADGNSNARITEIKVTCGTAATVELESPVLTPAPGVYGAAQTISISAAEGASIYYTVNGAFPTVDPANLYTEPFTIDTNSTIRAIAELDGKISLVTSGDYTFEFLPVITPAGGLFYDPVEVTIFTGRPDASIYYTTDGTEPTAESTLYEGPFTIAEDCTITAIAFDEIDKEGTTETLTSLIASAQFTFNTPDYTFVALQEVFDAIVSVPVWNHEIDPYFPISKTVDETKTFRFDGRLVVTHVDSVNMYVWDGFNFDINSARFQPKAKGEDPYPYELGRIIMPGGVYRLTAPATQSPGTTDNYLAYTLVPLTEPAQDPDLHIYEPEAMTAAQLVAAVDTSAVNRLITIENVTFSAATPLQNERCTATVRTFTGTAADGTKLTFTNRLSVEAAKAGSYDVTAIVSYKSVITAAKTKTDENGETIIVQPADTTVTPVLYPLSYVHHETPIDPDKQTTYTRISGMPKAGYYTLGAGGQFSTALEQSKNYGYLPVVELTPQGDKLVADREIALELIPVEGATYRIRDLEGRWYYQTGTYNSFNVAAQLPADNDEALWTIEPQADGTYRITNVAKSKYIQYSERYNSYGSYSDVQGLLPTLWISDQTVGIDDIQAGSENAPVEIFDLRGIRVNAATLTTGVYIRRQGTRVEKIIVR